MHRIFILIILSYIAAAWTQTSPAPTATENAIASVRASIEAVRQKQQAMPEPRTDSDRLIRMGELEQAPRTALSALNAAEVDRAAVLEAMAPLMRQIAEANQQQLLAMVPEEGWFSISRYVTIEPIEDMQNLADADAAPRRLLHFHNRRRTTQARCLTH